MSVSLATLVGLVIGAALVAVTLPLAGWAARRDGDPRIGTIIRWGIVLKIGVFAPAQLIVANVFYHGVADFNPYNLGGTQLAIQFGHGVYSLPLGKIVGSEFVKIVTGAIYSVIGISEIGGFFIYSWLAFLGLFLFYRAFHLMFPEGHLTRYALMVFLWPSLLFWTSAIGKDALSGLALGAAAYGGARVLRYRPFGFTIVAAASLLEIMVRPWMALMYCGGLGFAYLVRRPRQVTASSRLIKYGGMVVLLVFGLFLAARTSSALHVESLNSTSVNSVLTRTTAIGGATTGKAGNASHFSVSRNPLRFPLNAFTVIFRPLPYEASGITSLGVSVESLVLMFLVVKAFRPAIWPAIKNVFRDPGVALIAMYTLLFIFVYSALSDFGDLERQRAQLLPFLFMLLAYTRTRLRPVTPPVLLSPGWREVVPREVPSAR